MIKNIVNKVLENGGTLFPLFFESENKVSLLNPSILVKDGKILINVRNSQYTLYHTNGKFESRYGPLCYLHPENDATLRSINYLGEWKDNKIINLSKVDTSILDIKPLWVFVGLEDVRLVDWEDEIYLSGVRRDTTTNGEGRMELSKIINNQEVSRFRIPTPFNKVSYCEKNWMPILDMPFHYVKWCNPVEVVKVNINGETEQVLLGESVISATKDMRGGSQVIKIGDHRICIIHETNWWFNLQNNKN